MVGEAGKIVLDLFILFALAKVAGELFERLRLPAVIGELIIGILIGPSALGLVAESAASSAMASLGVIVLLFMVGLETRVSDLAKVGAESSLTALAGIAFPFAFVYALTYFTGVPRLDSLFLATAAVATSVGITARVLSDLKAIERKESRVILGAAILDDILGLLILAIVIAETSKKAFPVIDVAVILLEVVCFVAFVAFVLPRWLTRHAHLIEKLKIRDAPLIVALVTMLGLSALSSYLGLASIVGAFFAGMIFAETEDRFELTERVRPIYEFLVPFFFIVTGTMVDLKVLAKPSVLGLGLAITLLAIAGKVLGGLLGASRLGFKQALAVGVGMVPRGEVGLIVASVGLSIGAISQEGLSQIVLMAVVTTLVIPPLLPMVMGRSE